MPKFREKALFQTVRQWPLFATNDAGQRIALIAGWTLNAPRMQPQAVWHKKRPGCGDEGGLERPRASHEFGLLKHRRSAASQRIRAAQNKSGSRT
jgi:hypothetical protein